MSIATRIQSMEEHIADAYDSLNKFGVAAPSNKNIENIASLVEEIYDSTPKTDYVSGTNLTLENTRVGKIDFKDTDTIEKIGLGATNQNGEPTPDSPQDINVVKGNQNILVQNKNLIEEVFKGYNINGRGQFEQVESSSTFDVNIAKVQAGETYILNTTTNVIAYFNEKPTTSSTSYNNAREVITATNTLTPTRSGYIAMRTATSNTTQLEKGTTATSYVPHQENNYEINLSGKNLLNNIATSQTKHGIVFTINENKTVHANGTATSSNALVLNQVYLKKGKTYFLSGCPNSGGSGKYTLSINTSGTLTRLATDSGNGAVYTPTESKIYDVVIGYWYGFNLQNLLFYPQLEIGNAATSYEPYKTPIELCKIDTYQDYIYKNGKNWYLHKEIGKIVLDESYNWTRDTNDAWICPRFYCTTLPDLSTTVNNTIFNNSLCNMATIGNTSNYTHYENVFILRRVNNTNRIDCMFNLESANELKNILATTPMIIYHNLITPTETQITDTTLISQLDAWYNAQSIDDITYITVNGDLPMQLKLRALKK